MPTRKRRPALDRWLQEADRVLAEQQRWSTPPPREHAAPAAPGAVERRLATWRLVRDLPRLLSDLVVRAGRVVLEVAAIDPPHRLVQFALRHDGVVLVEVVPDPVWPAATRLTRGQQDHLAALGWERPDPPRMPNWHSVHGDLRTGADDIAKRVQATLQDVFGLGPDDRVVLRLIPVAGGGRLPGR